MNTLTTNSEPTPFLNEYDQKQCLIGSISDKFQTMSLKQLRLVKGIICKPEKPKLIHSQPSQRHGLE